MELASVTVICETDGCPNAALGEMSFMLRLRENGQLPWFVCGVCQQDIIPNPEADEDVVA